MDVLGDMVIVLDCESQRRLDMGRLRSSRHPPRSDPRRAVPAERLPAAPTRRLSQRLDSRQRHRGHDGRQSSDIVSQSGLGRQDQLRFGRRQWRYLWRLGNGGDFKLVPATPTSWFSHQHDPRFEPLSGDRLMILDNGNLRRDTDPNAASRGQVYQLDESSQDSHSCSELRSGTLFACGRIHRKAVERQLLV